MKHQKHEISVEILRRELRARGVAVWNALEGKFQPIPVALTPTVVRSSDWQSLVQDARLVLGTFPKLMSWLQRLEQRHLFAQIFGGLSSIEALAAQSDPMASWGHATTRVDLFWHHGAIKIIEVNATIPAMQAYSDQTTQAWITAGGMIDLRNQKISDNQGDLLRGLLSLYRRDGGTVAMPRIAILHRPGDSQLGELQNLCRDWNSRGYQAVLVTPEDLLSSGDIWMAHGEPCDLVYRHLFAWRLEGGELAQTMLHSRRTHIYNPISAHYETKAFLAVLSQVADNACLAHQAGIMDAEMQVIKKRVPWSRIISAEDVATSAAELQDRLPQLVLKRSLGYGGHHVIMGDSWSHPKTQVQLKSLTQLSIPISLPAFLDWVRHEDKSLWIAQERMSGAQRTTEVLTASGIETWNTWYDASVFINTGSEFLSGGGVSRVGKTPVVNIGTGGGLAPFIIEHDTA